MIGTARCSLGPPPQKRRRKKGNTVRKRKTLAPNPAIATTPERLLLSPPLKTQVQEGYYTYSVLDETKRVTVETDRKHSQNGTRSTSTTRVTTATRTAEALCEPGYWCWAGLRSACDAGFYGDAFGETRRRTCSGPCKPGFICGIGSVSPEQRPCGVSR